MNIRSLFPAIATVLLSCAAFGGSTAACDLHAVATPTQFPERAQLRGQEGTVYINVRVDESGRVASTELHRSSGYRLLDRAAERSVRDHWRFDVSDCVRQDLPADRVIAVVYRNDEYR